MNTLLWLGFSVLWAATGILGVAWFARRRGNLLSSLRVGLPAFTAATMLIVVTASPSRSPLARILHVVGLAILGLFLLGTEFLRVLLRRQPEKVRDSKTQVVGLSWFPSRNCPVRAAGVDHHLVQRLAADVRLQMVAPSSWLWWVYVLFAAMMWHGAFFWTPEADRLVTTMENGHEARLPRGTDLLMTVHGVVFLVIFAIAFDRGARPLPHPCRALIVWLEHCSEFPAFGLDKSGSSDCLVGTDRYFDRLRLHIRKASEAVRLNWEPCFLRKSQRLNAEWRINPLLHDTLCAGLWRCCQVPRFDQALPIVSAAIGSRGTFV